MGVEGRRVRFGLLSTARINGAVLAGALPSEEVDVVAVASRSRDRAERYASEHGLERVHGSYDALLEDPDVDAVYVSLPNGLHVEWSVRALEAGKHVLCEKPLTRHPEAAERAFAAAEAADRFLVEAFMWRHSPQTQRLQALVAEGAIGELRLVRAAFSFSLTDLGDVRMRPELDGGALMDVGCYCVSGIRLLAGEPQRVLGELVRASTGVDVRFAAVLGLPNGVLGHFDCALDLPGRSALEAVGSEGSLTLDDPWHARRPGIDLRRGDGEPERIEVGAADSYRLELESLARAIRGEADPLLGRDDALGQARTLAALYRSAEEGRAVEL
ncbi:MAG: Gfo/Idh/MocA family oxidoreductase [Actinobacteria bacterium]|nr:Gfo/Idh/MocA family oxidoreductase [Actinomycetota bacterium]